jgi:hypothetical protein
MLDNNFLERSRSDSEDLEREKYYPTSQKPLTSNVCVPCGKALLALAW